MQKQSRLRQIKRAGPSKKETTKIFTNNYVFWKQKELHYDKK